MYIDYANVPKHVIWQRAKQTFTTTHNVVVHLPCTPSLPHLFPHFLNNQRSIELFHTLTFTIRKVSLQCCRFLFKINPHFLVYVWKTVLTWPVGKLPRSSPPPTRDYFIIIPDGHIGLKPPFSCQHSLPISQYVHAKMQVNYNANSSSLIHLQLEGVQQMNKSVHKNTTKWPDWEFDRVVGFKPCSLLAGLVPYGIPV